MRQHIARKRILTTAVALLVIAGLVLMACMRPQWQQEVGAPPINLGTAQMQAEVMAELIDLNAVPIPKIPVNLLPMPIAQGGSHQATAPVPVPEGMPQAKFDPPDWASGATIAVMDMTLPYCNEGLERWVCQDRDSVTNWADGESQASFHFRRQLETMLHAVNRRATRVPDRALELAVANAYRMSRQELRQRRARGNAGCEVHGYDFGLAVIYLDRPVFSVDGQWALASVAFDTCSGGTSGRILFLLHQENGRWTRTWVERGGPIRNGRGLWPELPWSWSE